MNIGMNIGITDSGKIWETAVAVDRLVHFVTDYEDGKANVSRSIREIGFAPLDTGSVADGGRRQQPGSPIFDNPMVAKRARRIFAGINWWREQA